MLALGCLSRRADDQAGRPAARHIDVHVAPEGVAQSEMPAAEAPQNGNTAWGEDVNGLQVGIAVLGPVDCRPERMRFRLCQRNVGEAPLRVLKMDSRRRYYLGLYEVMVDGKPVRCTMALYAKPDPPPSAYFDLATGEEDSASEMLMLADGWDMRPPCTAEIRLVVRNERPAIVAHDAEGRAVSVSGLWTGTARSGPVAVEVTPPPSSP